MTKLVSCETCCKEFITQKGKYCSKECRPKYTHICEVCQKEYTTNKSISSGYCSKTCSKKRQDIKRSELLSNEDDMLVCLECGLTIGKSIIEHIKRKHNMTVEEYKLKHNVGAEAIFAESTRKKLSEAVSGEKNVWYNHQGKLSPFSKNNYRITEEERIQNQKQIIISRSENQNDTTSLEYWLKQTNGDEILARKLLKSRQQTFSLDKCIEKYGEEEGIKRWKERQEKWQETLCSKSEEEIERILQSKIVNGKSISNISQRLFESLNIDGARFGKKSESNLGEKMIMYNGKRFLVDFISNNKIIEFFGDYWHANPKKYKSGEKIKRRSERMISDVDDIWKKDKERISQLEELGYEVMIVWENDYRKEPQRIIDLCKNFLEN